MYVNSNFFYVGRTFISLDFPGGSQCKSLITNSLYYYSQQIGWKGYSTIIFPVFEGFKWS